MDFINVVEGSVSESQFRKAVISLAGTMLAQLLPPAAALIVFVAQIL